MAWPRVVSAQMERRRLVAEIFRRACQVFGFCVFGVKGKNPEVPRKTPRFLCSTPGYGAAIPCTLALKLQDPTGAGGQGWRRGVGRERVCVRIWLRLGRGQEPNQHLFVLSSPGSSYYGLPGLIHRFCLRINMIRFAFWVTVWRELKKGKQLGYYNSVVERKWVTMDLKILRRLLQDLNPTAWGLERDWAGLKDS